MQNPIASFNRENNNLFRYLLLLICAILVTLIIPKTGKFKYEFELGKPWKHQDLLAPFAFAIQKSPEVIDTEKKEIINSFKPFYEFNESIPETTKEEFRKSLNKSAKEIPEFNERLNEYYVNRGIEFLNNIYAKGIIRPDTITAGKPSEFIVTEVKSTVATDKMLADYYSLNEARSLTIKRTQQDTALNKAWYIKSLLENIQYNVFYDSLLSTQKLNELLKSVSLNRGMIEEGEKVISRGNIVTEDRYLALQSMKSEYENKTSQGALVFLGYLIIVLALMVIYTIFLEVFNKEIIAKNTSLILILINVLLFTIIASFIIQKEVVSIYIVPFCIIPIILLAFFGSRIAFLTHVLVILLCGLMVPNPYEFVLLQAIAGFTAILTMVRIRYISQFLISAMFIFFSYCIIYLGLNFVRFGMIAQIEWDDFMWFGINFILTLLAYPLIYANEKVFGFLSDISLLELSDINNKLLRELFLRAPGTFQHSLQVANLAEAVIDRIGGNSLLTRVGALYHDIGKLYHPELFVENQKVKYNPHDEMSDIESAEAIIAHVTKGIEMAQEYNLPKNVIDFIRSHHGTTRVEYFYKHYVNEHENEDVDENIFRYPGPKPFSKETAVVMISDSIEAASRSLKEPDDKQIDLLVDKIIDNKIQDNQFDYATITIQEINTARRILKKMVKSIHHIRVQYPSVSEPVKSTV